MVIPEEYIIQKFYQHAGYPKYVKSTNTYMGGCPICREGKSWGRKSRLYYIPKDDVICCHNCGWYGKPGKWIMEVEQITYNEMVDQINTGSFTYGIDIEVKENKQTPALPLDSINLFDKSQLLFYASSPVVRKAAKVIIDRRLNTAVNRPRALYISLVDFVHKNRLTIPFYDRTGKCVFYQSRSIGETDPTRPKYLSKQNSDKTLFNYGNVSSSAENIFVTEGPIDSFFIRDSVAVAGIQERSKSTFTPRQSEQISSMFLSQVVWVLDSQYLDTASLSKTKNLLKSGECVFIWPEDVGKRFKDINDMCVYFSIDEISPEYILSNTYCGLKGLVKLKSIK